MMSSSTIFIKQPLRYCHSLGIFKQPSKEYTPILPLFLWIFCSCCSIVKSTFTYNISGLNSYFIVYEILAMVLSSLFLYVGLIQVSIITRGVIKQTLGGLLTFFYLMQNHFQKQSILFIPWIICTLIDMYYRHFPELLQSLSVLKPIMTTLWLPWGYLTLNAVFLVVRGTIILRIIQLWFNIWLNRKLKEIKTKQ